VVWFVGKESNTERSFDDAEQLALLAYLLRGGALFVSGSDIAWDLDAQNWGREFFRVALKARYKGDDAPAASATGTRHSIFEDLTVTLDDGTGSAYLVDKPDFIEPADGAAPAMFYNVEDTGFSYEHTAAIQYA